MKCTAKNQSGDPCGAPSQSGSEFCFSHDPGSREARKEAQRKGGLARTRSVAPIPVGEIDLSDPAKIVAMVTRVANQVCVGRLDAKRAHALGHLADCALKAIHLGAFKRQQDHIERMLEEERNRPANLAEAEHMLRFVPVDEDEPPARTQRREVASAKLTPPNGNHGQKKIEEQS
jgi:hypothetical protein